MTTMKTDRLLVIAFVLFCFGILWLAINCHGTAGFSAGWPLSASNFNLSITNRGSSAVIGVICTLIGFVGLLAATVGAAMNMANARRMQ